MKTLTQRASRTERAILILGFMALFPGFFFYHFLLGTGRIRAFLGGYFSPVSLIFAVPIFLLYIGQIRRERVRLFPIELYFGLFLAFFAAVIAANWANGANQIIVGTHVLGIMFMVNTFIMFKMIDFAQAAFRVPAILCLLGMSAVIVGFSVDGMFRMDALAMAKDPDSLSTYQGFARSYLVTFLCVVAYSPGRLLRVLLYATGALSLFLNTARSEFVALLFAIPVIEFYYAKRKLLLILVLGALTALITLNFDMLVDQLPDNRILELLDLSHSNSAILRHHMNIHALQTISADPVFGDYASYASGHYAHNILSAWVDLGLLGFAYLLVLLIVPAISMCITGFFSKTDCPELVLAFALVCVTVLLLIKSHYFTDMLIGATLGAYSKYNYVRKYGKGRAAALPPLTPPCPQRFQALRQPRSARS